jgi:drug/metabolite transporter (DMT)-like permease
VTGALLGALGVLVFSFTFPATKLAERGFSAEAVAFGRAAVASLAAALVLGVQRPRRPTAAELRGLVVVAAGVVVGFPFLTALALRTSSSAHTAVVVGLLPAATAACGALRSGERPSLGFWVAAATGTAVVTAYMLARAGGGLGTGDAYLMLAIVVCAIAYAEGAVLARTLGAPHTICWALIVSAPLTVPVGLLTAPGATPSLAASAGFLYTCLGSMFLGFFAWYGGLARGGVARVSQLQLAQTPLTLLWSALVLGESIGWGTAGVALVVLLSVAATQRAAIRRRRSLPASALPRLTAPPAHLAPPPQSPPGAPASPQ